MDKRKTPESIMAHLIAEQVENAERPISLLYAIDGLNGKNLRETLRKLLRGRGVSTAIRGKFLYVFTKVQSREERLVEMVRRLAMHVDDESLYEEALALVKVI